MQLFHDIVRFVKSLGTDVAAFLVKAATTVLFGLLMPIKSWIVLIQCFVIIEYVIWLLVKKPINIRKTLIVPFTKMCVFLLFLMMIKALEAVICPQTPLTQYYSVTVLIYQLKQTDKIASEYTGVSIWDGVVNTLQNVLQSILKVKSDGDKR